MKKVIQILLIILAIVSCSDKSNKKIKNKTNNISDSIEVNSKTKVKILQKAKTNSIPNISFKIDFPLDSLLSFDSEKELKEVFGKHVKRSIGYYPEGMGEYNNTLLFPKSKNEVEFVWEDDSLNFNKLLYIKIFGKNADWKTKEGITIGTEIKELEFFNNKPFTFFGLGWDYSGSINWNEGRLDKRKIFGSLAYPNNILSNEFESLFGDHEIESSSKLAQKAKLILGEIVMRRNN